MARSDLTVERLRELLDYDPDTGVFTWRVTRAHNAKAGAVAGVADDGKGYRVIALDGRRHQAHRLAWLHVHGRWPGGLLDHRDRDPSNNRLANLREGTQSLNGQNRIRSPGSSGHVGVNPEYGRWRASFTLDRHQRWLGRFDSREEAAQVAHDARCIFHPFYPVDDAERGHAIVRVLNRAAQAAKK